MSGKWIAIAVALIIAAGAAVYYVAVYDAEYGITYELNGGSTDNPSSYHSSRGLVLKDAVHSNRTFEGWFDEDGNRTDMIAPGTSGEVRLSAVFSSNYGTEVSYSVSGSFCGRSVSGDAKLSYIKDDGKEYTVLLEAEYTDGQSSKSISRISGLSDRMEGYDIVFDERRLPSTIKWSTLYGDVILSKSSVRNMEVPGTVAVNASAKGIEIDGSGTYAPGDVFKLVPRIDERLYRIDGWYLDGGKVSGETVFSSAASCRDMDIVFKAEPIDREVSEVVEKGREYTLRSDKELSSGTWDITDKSTRKSILSEKLEGASPSYTFMDPGIYRISVKGRTVEGAYDNHSYDILVDGDVTRTFEWEYKDKRFVLTADIPYHIYAGYSSDTSVKRGLDTESVEGNTIYATYMDPVVIGISSKLHAMAEEEGFDDEDTAGLVLAFTQYIKYVTDSKNRGEYWNYAVETLYEQKGDCEDTSILFCALLKPMGYMVSEMVFPGHMSAGVALLEGPSQYPLYIKDGIGYYYCETSEECYIGYEIGKAPGNRFTPDSATIYPVL